MNKCDGFSVVMPYYKNSEVVHRSINSVLKQDFNSFELIIVDDGSEDNISEIVENYNDAKIKLFRQENRGVACARNEGISRASYEWICFLDSDDEWFPCHLSHLYFLINKYAHSKYFITSHRRLGNTVCDSSSVLLDFPNDFLCDNILECVFKYGEIIHTNSVCINRQLLKQYGAFVEGVSIGEDTDLWFRLSLHSVPVLSKKVTSTYHRDASFLTKNTKFASNWPFCKRLELLKDNSIPEIQKYYMRLLIQRYNLTICKHLLMEGNKEESEKLFNSLKHDLLPEVNRQKKQMLILLSMPQCVSRLIVEYIYKKKIERY